MSIDARLKALISASAAPSAQSQLAMAVRASKVIAETQALVPTPQAELAPEVPREEAIAGKALQALTILGFNVANVLKAAEDGVALPESEVPAELDTTIDDGSVLPAEGEEGEVVAAIKALLVRAGVEIVDDIPAGAPSASDDADINELNALSAKLARRYANDTPGLVRAMAHLTSGLNLVLVQAAKSVK